MVETQQQRGPIFAGLDQCREAIRTNKALLVMILVAVLIALVPLYGILFPPLADLPQHILVNKLLWERLSGVSHLDLEISWFLGYRLLSFIIVAGLAFCRFVGI